MEYLKMDHYVTMIWVIAAWDGLQILMLMLMNVSIIVKCVSSTNYIVI